MKDFEWIIIGLNLVVVLVAYLSIYPKLAGKDFNKISFYDLFVSGFVMVLVGAKYWGSDVEFNLLFGHVNWFWFTTVTYLFFEIPMMAWYFRKTVKD
ncbi:MAG TPA: hypothetical protein EYG68_07985 [Leucothrix mucor]|nr:hypothetical protein [Leucothrix mucor]